MKLRQLHLRETEQFPFIGDTDLNEKILDDALAAFQEDVSINYDFDVPYVAGYSKDGKTVYIDRDLPKFYVDKNKVKIFVEPYLVLHEVVEKTLLMRFKNLVYQTAHQCALRLEQSATEANGIDWDEYSAFFSQWIKTCGDEDVVSAPPNLDLLPYIDENDEAEIAKLKAAMK